MYMIKISHCYNVSCRFPDLNRSFSEMNLKQKMQSHAFIREKRSQNASIQKRF